MAIPSRVISLEGGNATVECFGVQRTVSTLLMDEQVSLGDYLSVMAGSYAVGKVPPEAAAETIAYLGDVLREPASKYQR